jgi:hypothetical protein
MARIGRVASLFKPEAELVEVTDDPRVALAIIATPVRVARNRVWEIPVLRDRDGRIVTGWVTAMNQPPGSLSVVKYELAEDGSTTTGQAHGDWLEVRHHAKVLAAMSRTELAAWPEKELARVDGEQFERASKIMAVLYQPAKLRKEELGVPLWVFADLSLADPPRRALGAVASVSFLGFDLDTTETPLAEVSERCGEILHVVYESPSNALVFSPQSPNGRLVVPLDRAVSSVEAMALLGAVNDALGGVAAPFGPAQAYWPPIEWADRGRPMVRYGGRVSLPVDDWLTREDKLRARWHKTYDPSEWGVMDGVLGQALKFAGYDLRVRETPEGEEYANCWCPARDGHTSGACKAGDFRVRAPFAWGGLGSAFCFHAGCRQRDADGWLALLPEDAVGRARAVFAKRIVVEG